jgi:hypothetical protein
MIKIKTSPHAVLEMRTVMLGISLEKESQELCEVLWKIN